MNAINDGVKIVDENQNDDSTMTESMIRNMLPIRMTSIVARGYGRGSTDLGIPTANLDRHHIRVLVSPTRIDSSTTTTATTTTTTTTTIPTNNDIPLSSSIVESGEFNQGQDSTSVSTLSTALPFDALPCGIYWGYARVGHTDGTNDTSNDHQVYTAAISIGYNPTYKNGTCQTIFFVFDLLSRPTTLCLARQSSLQCHFLFCHIVTHTKAYLLFTTFVLSCSHLSFAFIW
jgi:FAD synthase